MTDLSNSNSEELTLSLSRTINAPVDKVFDAWLNPKILAKFMIPGTGMCEPKVTTDAVEGGHFSIVMLAADKELPHHGVYQKITPHSQIIFTWESAQSIDGSLVTLNFQPNSKGTLIELQQRKFYSEETRAAHNGGWQAILQHLDQLLCAA